METIIHEHDMFYILKGLGHQHELAALNHQYDTGKLIEVAEHHYNFRSMSDEATGEIYFKGGDFSYAHITDKTPLSEYELLNLFLEDDDTETGGVAHSEERFADFVEEILQEDEDGIMTIINEKLKECGIKPIDPSKL